MEWATLGPLLGGAGQAAGGLASLFGGGGGSQQNYIGSAANQQLNFQMAAAANGIRWRVADAEAAGIHPLYALGAPTFNPGPTSFDVGSPSPRHDIGGALSNMGQGIDRAVRATQTSPEKYASIDDLLIKQNMVERSSLENDLLRAQIARMSTVTPNFPMINQNGPMASQGNLGVHEMKPNEVTTTQPSAPSAAAGPPAPSVQFTRSGNGLVAAPTKATGVEDEFGAPLMAEWLTRNRLWPFLNPKSAEHAPPMDLVRSQFPGATGVQFSRRENKWVPTYGGRPGPTPGWYEKNISRGGKFDPTYNQSYHGSY